MAKAESATEWDVWSRHGNVVVFLVLKPGSTIKDIAESLHLTERTIRDTVADLRRAGMLKIQRYGRRLHYRVNLDAPFRHPTIKDATLRTVLGALPVSKTADAKRRVPAVASPRWSAASPSTP